MKIVSLVPSWTETLISWGAPVVGRTRFCIHPSPIVQNISALGGTKNPSYERINALKPSWVVVDKEENNKEVQEKIKFPLHVSHVRGVEDMPLETRRLAEILPEPARSKGLAQADEWSALLEKKSRIDIKNLPGVIDWWRPVQKEVDQLVYVIWMDPWMGVARNTFIGSVLSHLGIGSFLPHFEKPYPTLEMEKYISESSLLLFSSEPFPFQKKKDELLKKFPNPMAFVDGESFSWFGERSLNFLSKNSL